HNYATLSDGHLTRVVAASPCRGVQRVAIGDPAFAALRRARPRRGYNPAHAFSRARVPSDAKNSGSNSQVDFVLDNPRIFFRNCTPYEKSNSIIYRRSAHCTLAKTGRGSPRTRWRLSWW